MTSSLAIVLRLAAAVLLALVAVVATSTEAVASLAPEWTADGSGWGLVSRLAATTHASEGKPGDRWSWPLQPRPVVVNRFDPPAARWGSGHRGVDLGARAGQAVLAPTGGVVAFRGTVVDRGVLVIQTSGGLRTTFEPVDSSLDVGTSVEPGQVIGTLSVGTGHCAPATCLHWGVLDGETYLDPLALVGAMRVVLLPLRPP